MSRKSRKAKREERKEKKEPRKTKRKENRKKLRKGIANIEATAVLFPFKPLMKRALTKKGHKPPKKMIDLVTMFYEVIILKKEHLEIDLSQYEISNLTDEEANGDTSIDINDTQAGNKGKGVAAAAKIAGAAAASNPISSVITGIVSAVLDYIKGLKKKHDSGATLTAAETEILNDANAASTAATDYAKSEVNESIGGMITEYWWVILVAVAALLFLRKK